MDSGIDALLSEFEEEGDAADFKEVSKDISDVYLWVLCALGIPGNVLTIISIVTMGKVSSATFLVMLLASYDGTALIAKLVGHLMEKDVVYVGTVGCKLIFIPVYLSTMANWTLALIALERFFSVCYPLQKVYLFTKKRTYILAGLNAFVLLAVYGTVFLVTFDHNGSGYVCGAMKEYVSFFKTTWHWINTTLFLFLPFILSMGFTIVIIIGLTKSRRVRRSMMQSSTTSSQSPQQKLQDKNRQLIKESERAERMITIMLILAAALFLVLSMPSCVYYLAYRESEDDVTNARWELYHQISYILLDSTHAVNFFLYFVSAKRFRNHIISLVTGKLFGRKRGVVGGSSASQGTESSKVSSSV